jgi:hypothetical protein
MFKGEPTDEVQKLLDEIKGEAVRGAQESAANVTTLGPVQRPRKAEEKKA